MKNIITVTTFATMMLSGVAFADNALPCTKVQFWISGIDTVPVGAEMHKGSVKISIAAHVLKPQPSPKLAQQFAAVESKI